MITNYPKRPQPSPVLPGEVDLAKGELVGAPLDPTPTPVWFDPKATGIGEVR